MVDSAGDLAWAVDMERWAERVQGSEAVEVPCPRAYLSHAKATRAGGHVVLVLTPSQEIKAFANGALMFAFGDARWRLLDIETKFGAWVQAVGKTEPVDLARRIFQAALNLAEDRRGALFVLLREPEKSLPVLVAPGDRILSEVVEDDPNDPENLSPRLAKRSIHHLARGQGLGDLDDAVVEALAGIDGAVVTDRAGAVAVVWGDLEADAGDDAGAEGGGGGEDDGGAGGFAVWAGVEGVGGWGADDVFEGETGVGVVRGEVSREGW